MNKLQPSGCWMTPVPSIFVRVAGHSCVLTYLHSTFVSVATPYSQESVKGILLNIGLNFSTKISLVHKL
jgi:hypothetical protein